MKWREPDIISLELPVGATSSHLKPKFELASCVQACKHSIPFPKLQCISDICCWHFIIILKLWEMVSIPICFISVASRAAARKESNKQKEILEATDQKLCLANAQWLLLLLDENSKSSFSFLLPLCVIFVVSRIYRNLIRHWYSTTNKQQLPLISRSPHKQWLFYLRSWAFAQLSARSPDGVTCGENIRHIEADDEHLYDATYCVSQAKLFITPLPFSRFGRSLELASLSDDSYQKLRHICAEMKHFYLSIWSRFPC